MCLSPPSIRIEIPRSIALRENFMATSCSQFRNGKQLTTQLIVRALQFGQFEHGFDKASEGTALCQGHVHQRTATRRRQRLAFCLRRFETTLNDRKRRAQVVRDICKHLAQLPIIVLQPMQEFHDLAGHFIEMQAEPFEFGSLRFQLFPVFAWPDNSAFAPKYLHGPRQLYG